MTGDEWFQTFSKNEPFARFNAKKGADDDNISTTTNKTIASSFYSRFPYTIADTSLSSNTPYERVNAGENGNSVLKKTVQNEAVSSTIKNSEK